MIRIFLVLFLMAVIPSVSATDKHALLIGVTQYRMAQLNRPALEFPEADASAVGELLKRNGYTVQLLLGRQATQAEIEKQLKRFEKLGSQDGVVFIGLFGHGVQYGKDAYFCPYDTRLVRSLPSNAVMRESPTLQPDPNSMTSMERIMQALTVTGASHRVLLADCCRNDPATARSMLVGRAFGSDMKLVNLPTGTAVIFSCSENQPAYEHSNWGHGALTKAFLDYCHELPKDGRVDSTVSTMVTPLSERVDTLVQSIDSSKVQKINPIFNGLVDLQIRGLGKPAQINPLPQPERDNVPPPEIPMQKPDRIVNNARPEVNRNRAWLPVLDARQATSETLPDGWQSDGLVTQLTHKNVVLIGRQGSGVNEGYPALLWTEGVTIDGDFDLTAMVYAPDGGRMDFWFGEGQDSPAKISLWCGRVSTGTYREWSFRTRESSGVKVGLNQPQQEIRISRRGDVLQCFIGDKAAGAFPTSISPMFSRLKIGMIAAREPAGLIHARIVPRPAVP